MAFQAGLRFRKKRWPGGRDLAFENGHRQIDDLDRALFLERTQRGKVDAIVLDEIRVSEDARIGRSGESHPLTQGFQRLALFSDREAIRRSSAHIRTNRSVRSTGMRSMARSNCWMIPAFSRSGTIEVSFEPVAARAAASGIAPRSTTVRQLTLPFSEIYRLAAGMSSRRNHGSEAWVSPGGKNGAAAS